MHNLHSCGYLQVGVLRGRRGSIAGGCGRLHGHQRATSSSCRDNLSSVCLCLDKLHGECWCFCVSASQLPENTVDYIDATNVAAGQLLVL